MLACALSFAIDGIDARPVAVEVDVRPGLSVFTVVGLGDAAVREARERVHSAILHSGFEFPGRRITANLAPAHVRKAGPGFDLALACGVLAASGQLDPSRLEGVALLGELSLDGGVRPCFGTLAIAESVRRLRRPGLIVAEERAQEAALVEGLDVIAVRTLREAVEVLRGARRAPFARREAAAPADAPREHGDAPDLADVKGQHEAVRALTVAAAGGHNLLLCGPPGTGKTLLARCLPSILPPLTRAEAIEVTRILSVAGRHHGGGLVSRVPFRAPHHTISAAGLVGSASQNHLGEASLAHCGVLFLDELSEFRRSVLDALRQPLEEGRAVVASARRTVVYPSRFMLVGATNPCPCGHYGDGDRCRCTEVDLKRYQRRISGPLIDRFDLLVNVRRPSGEQLCGVAGRTSASIREEVLMARERGRARLRGTSVRCNAGLDTGALRRWAALEGRAEEMLRRAHDRGLLSARGHHRILRVARTLADLEGSERIRARDVGQALALRQELGGVRGAVA